MQEGQKDMRVLSRDSRYCVYRGSTSQNNSIQYDRSLSPPIHPYKIWCHESISIGRMGKQDGVRMVLEV